MSNLSNYEKMMTETSLKKDDIAVIQEKIEGDLFIIYYSSVSGDIKVFSKGAELDKELSDLYHSIENSVDLERVIGDVMYIGTYTQEGEVYLNDLYDNGTGSALDFEMVNQECERLGFYMATVIHNGVIESKEHLESLIKGVEEVVITNFNYDNILNRQFTYREEEA